MQRIATAVLVVAALLFSAGGVAVTGRADPAKAPPAAEAQSQSQCTIPPHSQARLDPKAAELAAKDDVVPLNTRGYSYNAYDSEWRPQIPTAAPTSATPSVPAAPAKP